MAILGHIIKGAIYLKDFVSTDIAHIEAQNDVLKNLLEQAKDTQFEKFYKFKGILKSENVSDAFSKTVSYFDYKKINAEWWCKLHEQETDVTWPGSPSYFALSSVTTRKTSKRILMADDMIEAIH